MVGAAMDNAPVNNRFFINGRLCMEEEAKDFEEEAARGLSQDQQANFEKAVCEMCQEIPEPRKGQDSAFQHLLKTVFVKLGFGWERPVLPSGAASLHDLVAHLLVEEEVIRLLPEIPFLPTLLQGDSGLCLPLSVLRGKCAVVVNTASK